MCGIVAVFALDGRVDAAPLSRAMRALAHRGPDGEAFWISPRRNAGLAHTRLSIIGLENGAQPIASEDGQVQIAVNGEFYDFERIRGDLESRRHRFRTQSDSEIALHLYEEYGPECLRYLRGEFAFVLWDERQQQLFAARDRFGIKPLCHAVANGILYVASEAKALFAAGVRAAWDHESFFQAAHTQYTLADRTLFDGVKQVRPGHYLLSHDSSVRHVCYWDLDYAPAQEKFPEDEAALIGEFGRLLDDSVRLRLRADAPLCCHLSGGLDSSAVLGIAARHRCSIRAFSVSFEQESYDELDLAREMSAHCGAELSAVRITQTQLVEALPQAVYFSEGLAVNGHLSAKFILNRAIRQAGFKVALTGEGADEIAAGYAHLRADLFRSDGREDLLAGLHAANAASRGIMLPEGESLPLDCVRERLGYVPCFLEAKGTLGFKIRSILCGDFTARFAKQDCCASLLDSFDLVGQMRGRERVDQSLYLWTKTALANYILRTLGDGAEMAHSVEGRLPFLDHPLFEFARRLPVALKIKGSVEKHILRQAVRPLIPERIYKRKKHPFVAPPLSVFSTPAGDALIQNTLRSESFSSLPFFDRSKVIALLDRLPGLPPQERAALDPVLMTVLSAAILHDSYKL